MTNKRGFVIIGKLIVDNRVLLDMMVVIYMLIVFASFTSMEGVAWLTHKYLMHGLLWKLHQDHHHKTTDGYFEHNDYFFVIFAAPAMVCLMVGIAESIPILLFMGIGITLYGFCYFLVHDLIIHQRIKLFRNLDNTYFVGIRRAHKMHHKHLDRENGECFGMLWVPMKYFRKTKISSTA